MRLRAADIVLDRKSRCIISVAREWTDLEGVLCGPQGKRYERVAIVERFFRWTALRYRCFKGESRAISVIVTGVQVCCQCWSL